MRQVVLPLRGCIAMKKTSGLIDRTSFKKALFWILLGSLLLSAAACAGGGYQTYPAPSYPSYNYPGYYYRDYYGPSYYPEQDPEYWRMWQDRQGGG